MHGATWTAWRRPAQGLAAAIALVATGLFFLAFPAGARPQDSRRAAPRDGGPDLQVGIDLAGPVAAGSRARVTWRVRNAGDAPAEAVVLSATWPAALIVDGASAGGSAIAGGLAWYLGPLAPRAERLLTATFRVPLSVLPPSTLALAIEAAAEGSDAAPEDNRLTRDLLVRTSDLQLQLSGPAQAVAPAERVTHTLQLFNVGQGRAEALVVELRPAAGLTGLQVVDPPPGLAADWEGGRLRLRQAEVPGPWSAALSLVARVPATATTGMVLASPLRATLAAASRDELLSNNVAAAPDLAVVQPDLRLQVEGPDRAPPDEVLEYRLEVENRGTGPAHAVVLTASLPVGLELLAAIPPGRRVDGSTWVWERASLAPGDHDSLRLQARLDGSRPAGTEVDLRVRLAASGVDLNPADNLAGSSCRILPGPAAAVQALAEPGAVGVEGGRSAVTVRLRDAFGNDVADGTVVDLTATAGQVAPASALTQDGVVTATYLAGPLPGVARVTARSGRAEGHVELRLEAASLSLGGAVILAPGAGELQPGDRLTYRLQLRNDSLAVAREPVVVATLEQRVELVAARVGNQSLDTLPQVPPGILDPPPAGYRQLAWAMPDLAAGGNAELTLDLQVEPDPGLAWTGFDTLFMRAAVHSPTADANPGDQRHQQRSDVVAGDLYSGIELKSLVSSIRPGGLLVYQLTFGNAGQGQVSRGSVTVTVPAGTRFESWEATHGTPLHERAESFSTQSRELVWDFDSPLARTSGFLLRLSVDDDVAPERLLQTSVEVGAPRYDTQPSNNLSIDPGAWLSGVNLVLTAEGPQTAAPGEALVWRFQVRNQAIRDNAVGVVVKAVLPAGFPLRRSVPEGTALADGSLRWVVDGAMGPGAVASFELHSEVPLDLPAGRKAALRLEASSPLRDSYAADNLREVGLSVVAGPPAGLQLQPERTELRACEGDRVVVVARVSDAQGNAVADGSRVVWQASAGLVEPAEATTVAGVVTATLQGPRQVSSMRLQARSGEASAEQPFAVLPGRPARIALEPLPARLPRGAIGLLRASVDDACGNAAEDGLPVDFLADRGRFVDGDGRGRPLAGGRAEVRLDVGQEPGRLALEARLDTLVSRAELEVLEATPTPTPPPRHYVYLPRLAKAVR